MPLDSPDIVFYRRNLPHWHPKGASLFLTWRLYGTLPARGCTGKSACATTESAGARFKRWDLELDHMKTGPKWLSASRVAGCVVQTILQGATLQQYHLRAYVIMPNHIHLLIDPQLPLQRIMKSIKGVSARNANRILNHTGKPFWQDESYDHWVRSEEELGTIRRYIELNPVRAGLAKHPEDWPWSSASSRHLGTDTFVIVTPLTV